MNKRESKIVNWYLKKWLKEIKLEKEIADLIKDMMFFYPFNQSAKRIFGKQKNLRSRILLEFMNSFSSTRNRFTIAPVLVAIHHQNPNGIVGAVIETRAYKKMMDELGEIGIDKNRDYIFPEGWLPEIKKAFDDIEVTDLRALKRMGIT